MKIVHLLFGFFFWTVSVQAQHPITLTNCALFWKDGAGITGSTIGIEIESPGLPTSYVLIPMDSSQSCITSTFPDMNLTSQSMVAVNAIKNDDPLNGLSVMDLVMISDHILGLEPLPSAYSMLAADFNRSGSITTFDIVEERKLLMGIYTELPSAAPEWRFIPEYVQFPVPLNPFTTFPNDYYLTGTEFLAYDNGTLNVIGLKVGDVDGDANPTSSGYQPTGQDSLFVTLPDVTLQAGSTETVIPVMISVPPQAINGIQLKVNFKIPGISVVDVPPGTAPVKPENFGIFSNGLSVVLEKSGGIPIVQGQATFSIKIQYTIPAAVELKDAIEISNSSLPALAVGRVNSTNRVYRLQQRFGQTSSIFSPGANTLRATPVTPNPFTDKAFIQVELTEMTPVLLEVFDLAGRLRWSQEQTLSAGMQQLEIPAVAVDPGSMGWYRVRAGAGVATGKVNRQ